VVALVYGWFAYTSCFPDKSPKFAGGMGFYSVLAVIAAGLRFYVVGVFGSWPPEQAGEGAAAKSDGLE
jgi:hypothetical protein